MGITHRVSNASKVDAESSHSLSVDQWTHVASQGRCFCEINQNL